MFFALRLAQMCFVVVVHILRQNRIGLSSTVMLCVLNVRLKCLPHPTQPTPKTIGVQQGSNRWKSQCNLPPSGGELHLQRLPIPDIDNEGEGCDTLACTFIICVPYFIICVPYIACPLHILFFHDCDADDWLLSSRWQAFIYDLLACWIFEVKKTKIGKATR